MLYIVDKDYIRYAYIAPTEEISNQKIYLNNIADDMFYIPYSFSSITGVQYLDFSLVTDINGFIGCDDTTVNIIGDLYFNFKSAETINILLNGCLLSGDVKIILPSTITYGNVSKIFVDMQVYGNVFIVDASAEFIRNVFDPWKNSIIIQCKGNTIFVDYTAGHEDGAQALVDMIGGTNNQYSGNVSLGREVTI